MKYYDGSEDIEIIIARLYSETDAAEADKQVALAISEYVEFQFICGMNSVFLANDANDSIQSALHATVQRVSKNIVFPSVSKAIAEAVKARSK